MTDVPLPARLAERLAAIVAEKTIARSRNSRCATAC